VANVTQAGGEISDWSVTEGTLTLKVPDWADTAVQSFCLEIQGNEETAG
jgi:alpha-L-fucosidase